ncbi:chain length determinant protein EpsF [Pseudorhodoferax sp.]|uniref:chain length determinant protein EpsF n=1 Tax=Pseudorhodoferax sp. TaxID=1993553 RepID=UPI0039E40869
MRLAEFLVLLRARWKCAALVWLAVVVVVGAVTWLRTPEYTATAAVVLDVKSPDPIAGVVLPGMTVSSYMGTQLSVVQSERVALRVVQSLGLEQDASLRAAWQEATGGKGSFSSWLVAGLLRKLDATPTRDSNMITISYTAADAERAADVVNAWVRAYIDTTLELRVQPARQYSGFFDAHGKQLREELEQAQARLSSYQRRNGLVATDERVDVENQRLAELSSQLVALQGQADESAGRLRQSTAHPDQMPEVLANPVIGAMTTELARYEAQQRELGTRLGANHPEMRELAGKIAELRRRVTAETRRVAEGIAVNHSVNRERLGQTIAAIDAQRAKLLRLKAQRDEAGVLERDVENARRAYDAVLAKASQASVESHATQTNVSVLKQATPPPTPSSPRTVLNMAVAVIVGVLLALATALMRELRDRRVRTTADVLQGLRQPLLGVLPGHAHRQRRGVEGRGARWAAQIAAGPAHGLRSLPQQEGSHS